MSFDLSVLDATKSSKSSGLYLHSFINISSLTVSYASSAKLFSSLKWPSIIVLKSSCRISHKSLPEFSFEMQQKFHKKVNEQ